ncbi:MAG: ABC transporter ATP-binding protein [Clostridia bacterium]|nr:ABC transporter ATP-binding protein [Clostridia bacterium]
MSDFLLEVKDLEVVFNTNEGLITAVNKVSFRINKGETVGLVGESGCGKSVTSLAVMRLLAANGKIKSGQILFNGSDLLLKTKKEMRKIRGNEISMIFQEPMTSLNPVITIGEQLEETIRLHQKVTKKEAIEKSIEALKIVGIPLPEKRIKEYPHQLSGGMRQMVMIAMALACNPKLLIADEPTTALDVTIQAQILDLMKKLKKQFSTSIMLITHDLGVVAEMAQRVLVMYAGEIVEEGPVRDIFQRPLHPYTEGLLKSIPRIDRKDKGRLHVIKGTVPNPLNMPAGCRFSPRCIYAEEFCFNKAPQLLERGPGRLVSCWKGGRDKNE